MTYMDKMLHILQHSLGLDRNGQGRAYRNHFVTSEGSTDWPHCCALVGKGLMEMHEPSELSGGSPWFVVTDAGRSYVDEHKHEAPKLTAGQKRYRDYLRISDIAGISFGQWLKGRVVDGQRERA
jgi:hypothetical protein